jgi:hypothetical protein
VQGGEIGLAVALLVAQKTRRIWVLTDSESLFGDLLQNDWNCKLRHDIAGLSYWYDNILERAVCAADLSLFALV